MRPWIVAILSGLSIASCGVDICGCDFTAVALGDSVTLGSLVTTPYPQTVATLRHVSVINAGVSGNTTAQMLTRWTSTYKTAPYQMLFLMGGLNDSAGQEAATVATLTTLATQAVSSGYQVRLLFVTPCAAQAAQIATINALLSQYAATNPPSVKVLDVWTPLSQGNGLAPIYDSGDGRHPNQAGTNLIANVVSNSF